MGYGAGGVSTFLGLKDTPGTYTGQALKLAKVNVGETALSLDLLLSFTDWYAGTLPTDFPWVFEANLPDVPATWTYCFFSPVVKNAIGQYIVYVCDYDQVAFFRYNLTTKQWHRLADPPEIIYNAALSMSPDGKKLAIPKPSGNVFFIYDIEANTWITTGAAPQIGGVNVRILATVWMDDNDTVWCAVDANVPPWTNKCFRYVVSTTTWTQFANSLTPADHTVKAIGITPDETALYFASCGADYNDASKYVIATDTYTTPISVGASFYFSFVSDQHRLWYGAINSIHSYVDLLDESLHTGVFPVNAQVTKASSIPGGIYNAERIISHQRDTEPKMMSYSGTGYWKLAEKVLTDYNLVVFRKPADGYAILAIDKVNGFTIPIYIFSTLTLPAGTWEFFYPKDGDYTELKISGSVLK